MSAVEETTRRRGGREARKAIRSQAIPRDASPVRPGLEAGHYKPLKQADLEKIHHAALDVLEKVGMANSIPSCVEVLEAKGCKLGDDGRLRFPRALIEDTLTICARRFPLYARDPKHDLEPWGSKVHFGTAGAAVHIVEPKTETYRDSLLVDLYDAARIVDTCEHIHFYQRPVVARDMVEPRDLDVNTLYACIAGTTKHVGTSMVEPDHVRECLEMLHIVAGGEDKWRERPFASQSNCFVVPPMKWAEDACRCLEVAVHGGMPVLLLSAGQAGATSPAPLAGDRAGGGRMPGRRRLCQRLAPGQGGLRHRGRSFPTCGRAQCRAARASRR
jgi:trimethylamine--corrinoid protein Co-methyltransferase